MVRETATQMTMIATLITTSSTLIVINIRFVMIVPRLCMVNGIGFTLRYNGLMSIRLAALSGSQR